MGLLLQYFMTIDGSFIKLFPGLVQRALIASTVAALIGPQLIRYLTGRSGSKARFGRHISDPSARSRRRPQAKKQT
jgi:hypothetical protein